MKSWPACAIRAGVGFSAGSPICLAPINDLLGLVLAEGIEDALTLHAETGLGAWAAGCASRLPALADVIPAYIELNRNDHECAA